MNLDDYQAAANATSAMQDEQNIERITVAALGLAGEAGEVADEIKKIIGHGHYLDLDRLGAEIGDVLWYVAEIASALNLTLSGLALRNLQKLQGRYPDGFDPEASRSRITKGPKD